MSCHYSCLTCSGSIYADFCLSCPTTRQLIDTTCLCNSGLYEYQTQSCLTYDQISAPDYTFTIMLNILYYIMIGFSWFIILGNLNHLYSSKIRCMVTFCQLISLLLDYRYRFTALAQKALTVFSVWNFRYFDTLLCSQQLSKPLQCNSYQNLYGPLLTLAVFIVAFVVSFIMTKTCIFSLVTQKQSGQSEQQNGDVVIIDRGQQYRYENSTSSSIKQMTFFQYVKISFKSFLLLYIDYTVVQWTVQLSRIGYLSTYWSYGVIGVLVFLTIIFALYFLSIINSNYQFHVQYRSRMGYLYIYDKKYYLKYLDFLYDQEKAQRNSSQDNQKQNQTQRNSKNQFTSQRFYPQSSYIVLQIVIKFFISAMTIMTFAYKPQLWVIPSLILMLIVFLKLEVFQVYQRLALLLYCLGMLVYFICVLIFWIDYFFNTWTIILALISTAAYFVLLVSDLSDWTREKEGKFWQVAFEYLDQDHIKQVDQQNFHLKSQQHQQTDQNLFVKSESFNNLVKTNAKQNIKQNDVKQSNKQSLNQTNKIMSNKQQSQSPDQKVVTKTMFGESKLSFKKNLNPSERHSIKNNDNDALNNKSEMKSKNSFNNSNQRSKNSFSKAQSAEKSNNLPYIQEDKQQSEENQNQGRGNFGDRASNQSLLGEQKKDVEFNNKYENKLQKIHQASVFSNATRKMRLNEHNIFQSSQKSKK